VYKTTGYMIKNKITVCGSDVQNKTGMIYHNPEKTKYTLMLRSQKIGQKHSIKVVNRSFEDVAKFIYLGTTLTDQNCVHKDIKGRLNSVNACYHSVQSSVLLPAV
jgi:hypothetical protein